MWGACHQRYLKMREGAGPQRYSTCGRPGPPTLFQDTVRSGPRRDFKVWGSLVHQRSFRPWGSLLFQDVGQSAPDVISRCGRPRIQKLLQSVQASGPPTLPYDGGRSGPRRYFKMWGGLDPQRCSKTRGGSASQRYFNICGSRVSDAISRCVTGWSPML